MRQKILDFLYENLGKPVSGEELSEALDISRTAVWKHIKVLKDKGYSIASLPRKGYMLETLPDRMFAEYMQSMLQTKLLGNDIEYFDTIGSTNEKIKEYARQGHKEGLLVIAEEQTHGKGRLGRNWSSNKFEGLWFSILLRPNITPLEASKLTLVSGLSVAQAINDLFSLKVGIKWPNDIVYEGKKLAGILTEINGEMEAINYLVLGIGINANQQEFDEVIASKAISLKQILGKSINRQQLLIQILNRLESNYHAFLKGDFSSLLDGWKQYCVHLNQRVKILNFNGEFIADVLDVDPSGALRVVDLNGKSFLINSGEISLRGLEQSYI